MTAETPEQPREREWRKKRMYNPPQPVYGLGFIGAAIYYISHATTIWMGVIGFFKAIGWPLFLVYEALKYLGAS